MTPASIDTKIAEVCGWRKNPAVPGGYYPHNLHPATNLYGAVFTLPTYHVDLNAMHEAEKKLSFSQRIEYKRRLQKIMSIELEPNMEINMSELVFATAPQRAEAFLRVLGLWKEGA